MPHPAPATACTCPRQGQQPSTLTELEQAGSVEFLTDGQNAQQSGSLEMLALIGTQLSNALISANTGGVLLSTMGGFGPYQDTGMGFRIPKRRPLLRIHPTAPARLARTRKPHTGCPSLVLLDPQDTVRLRITVQAAEDINILDALPAADPQIIAPAADNDRSIDTKTGQDTADNRDNIIPLTAVRAARTNWRHSDAAQHLNDFCTDRGQTRRLTLPHIGRNHAWPIMPQALPRFLSFLTERAIPHTRMIPGAGYIQGDLAQGGQMRQINDILLIASPRRHFALDLSHVTSVWVTQFSDQSQIEIYDQSHRALAILGSDPKRDTGLWNSLLASLPPIVKLPR